MDIWILEKSRQVVFLVVHDHVHNRLLPSFTYVDCWLSSSKTWQLCRAPCFFSTAISGKRNTFGWESILSSLISRNAVMGNWIESISSWLCIFAGTSRTYTILLVVHENLLQGNNSAISLTSSLVNLSSWKYHVNYAPTNMYNKIWLTQMYPHPAFPKTRNRLFSNILGNVVGRPHSVPGTAFAMTETILRPFSRLGLFWTNLWMDENFERESRNRPERSWFSPSTRTLRMLAEMSCNQYGGHSAKWTTGKPLLKESPDKELLQFE